jgi:hypothetical protein
VVAVSDLLAQGSVACVTDTLNARIPVRWLGTNVGQITVNARNVEAPTALLRTATAMLHHPTRLSVALQEFTFHPGERLDSLELLETARRLRRNVLYSEVILTGTQCQPGVTDFTLATRDAWSLRTDVRYNRTTSRASIADINLFGTGRALTVQGEALDDRNSISVGLTDPYLFGTRARGALQLRNYLDGRSWQWSVRAPELSPRDPWRGGLVATQLRRVGENASTGTINDIDRRYESGFLSRRITDARGADATYALVFGVEHERTRVTVTRPGASLGRRTVQRDFTAPLVGVARRSATFGTIDWLVPGQPQAELAVGVEGEMVVGVGRDAASGRSITHVDGWAGGTATPRSGTVLTGDLWWSGYWNHDSLSNGTLRMQTALYQRGVRGVWSLRATLERLYNPDPDVFALSTVDPGLRTLLPAVRLAEGAFNASVERSVHLYSSEGRWSLDGAFFTRYSARQRGVDPNTDVARDLQVVIAGVGLRRVRNQPTQPPLTLDVGYAVWRTPGLPARFIVVLQTLPWINGGRSRDGLREATR